MTTTCFRTATSIRACMTSGVRGWSALIAFAAALVATAGHPGDALAQNKAAFLLPGSINDQSWNAQGYQGAEKLKSMGWEIAYTENVQAADMVEGLRDYARRNFNVVVGHTGRFLSALKAVRFDAPSGKFRFDSHQNVVINLYVRKVQPGPGGKLVNAPIDVLRDVEQYWPKGKPAK